MSFKNNRYRGWALGCVLLIILWALIILGAYAVFAESSLQIQSTYTPNPTYTAWTTFTPCPTENEPTPTFTPLPTSTPYPTQTQYPDQNCPVVIPPTDAPTEIPPTFTPTNTPVVSAGHYYVSVDGEDGDWGTTEFPWRTIQYAANNTSAGNTVHVIEGVYTNRVYVSNDGVTYIAEGEVTTKGFTVYSDYITIRGFDISSTVNDGEDGTGLFVSGDNCILEDNYVYFSTWGGAAILGRNCVVRNNRFFRNGMQGIDVNGRNHIIEGNEIWGTIQYHPSMGSAPSWVDADGILFFGSGHIFRNNYIHDISYDDPENVNPHIDCFSSWSDGYHEAASDILFEGNFCDELEIKTANESAHGWMISNTNNVVIRNNIINAFGGVKQGGVGGNSNLTIVNNVIASDLSFWYSIGISLDATPNAIIKNNIFYNQPGDTMLISNDYSMDIDYNLFWNDVGSSDCYNTPNSLCNVDPLLNDDYTLQPGSPAIDAGVDVGLPYIGAAPDIGAFEH